MKERKKERRRKEGRKERKKKKERISSLTSLRRLKLLGGAGGTLSFAIINSDIELVETEGVQTGQQTAAVVPTEGQDLFLHVMGVVFVEAALSPVVHLQPTVSMQLVLRMYHSRWCTCCSA